MTLIISTPYRGEAYRVENDGQIVRLDMPDFIASKQWLMVGLVRVNSTRLAVSLRGITQQWLDANPLRYKNGNPRYTIRDLDHGTIRDHGNTVYHGVSAIRITTN